MTTMSAVLGPINESYTLTLEHSLEGFHYLI